MQRFLLPAWLLAAALAFSCGGDDEFFEEDGEHDSFASADGKVDAFGIREGSPEALGVLRVANEVAAAKLAARADVNLGTRTAGEIVKVRAGKDGVEKTRDDVKFATLVQLDRVPYVGKVAFERLLAYARKAGFVTVPTSGSRERQTTTVPWSGYYWSMLHGELALGWTNSTGRTKWTESQAREFDGCITSTTTACTSLLGTMGAQKGAKLSPLMKFDLWVRRRLEVEKGVGGAASTEYARSTKWELDYHYIGSNTSHRYWDSRGYAGKCIGWALSTMFHREPVKEVELDGIVFTPADIKGLLAAIYNGAQFFVPEEQVMGNEYRNQPGSNLPEYYADVHPHELMQALALTIDRNKMLEADLDPGDGVWNYPIYKYSLTWTQAGATTLSVKLALFYADDEVPIEGVFSTNPARPDIKRKDLTFELTVPASWDGDLAKATGGRWTGASVNDHPDALILGIEEGWRTAIYSYSGTQMRTEVNFPLLKRARRGSAWVPLVDELLAAYYAR
jgi:hypothetical protein